MAERAPRKDVQRNRAALVEAARRAFAAQGLDAPLEPIAAAACLGNATLYRHFPTRPDLWEAVLQEPLQEVLDLAIACTEEPDPWTGFARYLRDTATIEARRTGFSELMTTRFEGAPELLRLRAAIQDGVATVFVRAQDSGAIRADAALEDIALAQVSIAAVIRQFGEVAPEVPRRWVDIVLGGFAAADPPPLEAPAIRPNQIWRGLMRRGAPGGRR